MPTVRIPLVGSPNNRSGDESKDQRFINCYPEVIKNNVTESNKIFLQKRFGTSRLAQPAGAVGVARGIFPWAGYLISVIGTKIYFTTLAGVSTQFTNVFTTSTGYVGFCEAVDNGVDVLIITDGVILYKLPYAVTLTVGSLVACGGTYPSPHVPTPVFLDGYLFIQKTTGEIYNSAVHDVDSWNATHYITPESFQDAGVGIARQNNLIVAFGEYSIEFFYDAAETTSPLLPNEQATIQFGCAAIATVAQNEGLVVFVAQSQTGGKFVVAIDGTEPHNISNAAIERMLEAEGSDITDAWAYMIRTQGHFFYVLNLDTAKRTVVYDFETKMWHEWNWYDADYYRTNTCQAGSTGTTIVLDAAASAVNDYYNGAYVTITSGTGSGQFRLITDYVGATKTATVDFAWTTTPDATSVFVIEYYTLFPMIGQAEIGNTSYMLHDSDGYLYVCDPDLYQDNSNKLRVQIQTSKFDGDTTMIKFCNRLSLVGDFQSNVSFITYYHSDDDYKTWKPANGRTMDLQTRSYLYRLGSFRRRAFMLIHTANTPMRLEAIELELGKGIH